MHFSARKVTIALSLGITFAAGLALGSLGSLERARAEPQPALDRQIVERLVRAQEAQVHALEALTRATEHCSK